MLWTSLMMSYLAQSDLANEGDSVRDEDESENARRNGSNSPYPKSSIPNADLTAATDMIVGYVESRDYHNNMEMEQYHYSSGDITTDEEDEENENENGENSGHENAVNKVLVFRFSRILTRVLRLLL
ncbi:unnamed protein product [Orchesella dallaii]|uniref:Uncharacterized protein n=1 Tax=Orchesella dallaii TaxID=48710 RepID=A0ABP1RK95_9HEXA